jgi:hypothetical protein
LKEQKAKREETIKDKYFFIHLRGLCLLIDLPYPTANETLIVAEV